MEKLIDFAFSRPSPAAIKAAGYAGVIRYLCIDATKYLSPSEAKGYHAVGLTVTLVYEDGAADAEGGQTVGAAKAAVAKPQLTALAVPVDRPVYFAVDENIAPAKYSEALACIQTFASDLGRPQAVYGPRPFLVFCKQNHVAYLWETSAASWNTGSEPTGLQLRQQPDQVIVGGAACDEDIALVADYGQWPYNAPVPKPTPSESPPEENVKIYSIQVTTNENGNGFVETTIPWSNFVAVSHEGTRSATHFAEGEAHAAPVNNIVAVSVTGAVKSGIANVLVAATA